jgi:hypothetical protein
LLKVGPCGPGCKPASKTCWPYYLFDLWHIVLNPYIWRLINSAVKVEYNVGYLDEGRGKMFYAPSS